MIVAKKSLGQHFLRDLTILRRIVSSVPILPAEHILEIGPGMGSLTNVLLKSPAQTVTVIERDNRLIPHLERLKLEHPDRLRLVFTNALEYDYGSSLRENPTHIVSNLPYNIGTTLLINWLKLVVSGACWRSMTLMFQKEVAERIVATHTDSKSYGRLSVLTKACAEAKILFHIAPQAFTPKPKVESSVVQFFPKPRLKPEELHMLENITGAAFGQRRKMIRRSLSMLFNDASSLCVAASLEGTERAENLTFEQFCSLSHHAIYLAQ